MPGGGGDGKGGGGDGDGGQQGVSKGTTEKSLDLDALCFNSANGSKGSTTGHCGAAAMTIVELGAPESAAVSPPTDCHICFFAHGLPQVSCSEAAFSLRLRLLECSICRCLARGSTLCPHAATNNSVRRRSRP